MTETENQPLVWKQTTRIWSTFIGLAALFAFVFYDGLKELVRVWGSKEEYSYGYMIPFIVLFLIWQKKDSLERISFPGSWLGAVVTLFGLTFLVVGNLSAIYAVTQFSFVITLAGLALAFTGWMGFRIVSVPLMLLVFSIPLPQFFFQEISNQLQLISSQIGVWVIRLFGISVFLEGNVIDLGTYRLQVVEACSGLRYLFPLMTLGFIAVYFFKETWWKRAVIFLSTIPITILMNSLRIGIIGILVEYWGQSQAEGFIHDFEGWAIFMACTTVLLAEMWALARFSSNRRPLREVFGIEFPAPTPADAKVHWRKLPMAFIGSSALIALVAVLTLILPKPVEIIPARQQFSLFPSSIGGWEGKNQRMEQVYLNYLKVEDYILADYRDGNQNNVNFYVAYYASQKKGQSAHSPRTCIPGGGWEIKSLTRHNVQGVLTKEAPLWVNRVVIQNGANRQLVYYWFQERGRIITNEYLVKWYIFWDALTRNRTDGALIRLTAMIPPGADVATVDKQLTDFSKMVAGILENYIPD